MGEGLLSISSAGCGPLVNCMVYLDQLLHIYLFQHCPVTGMQNGDKAFRASF